MVRVLSVLIGTHSFYSIVQIQILTNLPIHTDKHMSNTSWRYLVSQDDARMLAVTLAVFQLFYIYHAFYRVDTDGLIVRLRSEDVLVWRLWYTCNIIKDRLYGVRPGGINKVLYLRHLIVNLHVLFLLINSFYLNTLFITLQSIERPIVQFLNNALLAENDNLLGMYSN